jgi:hypothetical protein
MVMGAVALGRAARVRGGSDVLVIDADDIELSQDTTGTATVEVAAGKVLRSNSTMTFLDAVAAFIPSEALALYVLLTAFLGSPSFALDIVLTMVTLAVAALLVACSYFSLPHSVRSRTKFWQATVFALIAALVYLAALPDSFVHGWPPYNNVVGGLVLLVASVVLPAVANALGLRPGLPLARE